MKRSNIRIVFLIILPLFLWASASGQTQYRLAEQDSMALVAFYHATDGPNWTSNQNGFGLEDLSSEWQGIYYGGFNKWLEGPVRDWFGVELQLRAIPNSSDSIYRVVRLWPVIGRRTDGQNQLKGYIPREVGLLTALEGLYVNGNNGLEWSELPDDLYHSGLKYLDIESAWFGGEISDAFRQCSDIRKMNFRYNYIDYMPTLDFLDAEGLYKLEGTQWFYSTRLSLAMAEKNVDYFYTISSNPKEFGVEYRDLFDVGDEQEFVAPLGSSVEMECTSAGEQEEYITYQWFKNGLSMFGKTDRILSIASVAESDYAEYTVRITNDYVKAYDANSNYGEVFTKPKHLVSDPVPPEIMWAETTYNGKELKLRFSKPMETGAAGYDGFTITAGARTLTATAARTQGRTGEDVILSLNEPVYVGDAVSIDYGGTVLADKNGGLLLPLSDSTVKNMVRSEPVLLSANTTRNGRGIEVWFDNYLDESFINASDFSITRAGDNTIAAATLIPGEVDSHISSGVLLSLTEPVLDSTEVLTVRYTRGELAGLYSGVVNTSADTDVSNDVSLVFTDVLLTFEDGSKSLEDILIEASWELVPVQMYDDGTHGDTLADDHNWACTASLVDEQYTWDVISRTYATTYDTTWVEDSETGVITIVLSPNEDIQDSLLSEGVVLEFEVLNEEVNGSTSFGINNKTVAFNVTLAVSSENVYLMGIEEDWGTGLQMTYMEGEYIYTVSVPGFTQGDRITYNYRDGNNWENQTAEPRSYDVQAEGNTLNDVFGGFTGASDNQIEKQPLLYPNPAADRLHISGLENTSSIEIYSLSGQLMNCQKPSFDAVYETDVSDFEPGLYLVKLITGRGTTHLLKFIKY